jgi:pimeloyl-ACP methyl ester carboxylesterase
MSKAPLLFVHGMWSRPGVWDRFQDHFKAQGHDTAAVTLPFHDAAPGEPPAPELGKISLRDYADAVVNAVNQAPAPPVLIGHSMGGLLVQLAAARANVKGLVCLSPAPSARIFSVAPDPLKTLWPALKQWGFWAKPTLPDRASAFWGVFNGVPAAEAEAEFSALLPDSGKALAEIAFPWLDGKHASFVDYGKIKVPALVVCGTADRITPLDVARATARKLQAGVTYRELNGSGHWIIGDVDGPKVITMIESYLTTMPA